MFFANSKILAVRSNVSQVLNDCQLKHILSDFIL